jgi:hypothetical protein
MCPPNHWNFHKTETTMIELVRWTLNGLKRQAQTRFVQLEWSKGASNLGVYVVIHMFWCNRDEKS